MTNPIKNEENTCNRLFFDGPLPSVSLRGSHCQQVSSEKYERIFYLLSERFTAIYQERRVVSSMVTYKPYPNRPSRTVHDRTIFYRLFTFRTMPLFNNLSILSKLYHVSFCPTLLKVKLPESRSSRRVSRLMPRYSQASFVESHLFSSGFTVTLCPLLFEGATSFFV